MAESNHPYRSTDAFWDGYGVHPGNGRVTTMWDDAKNYGSQAGGAISGVFNWVSNAMDDHPSATKWIVGGLAFLGILKLGMNRGMLTMLGDNIVGRTICFALISALALGGANALADWASNKGADKRAGHEGRLENTATLSVPQGESQKPGTATAFNNNASGAVTPPAALPPGDTVAPAMTKPPAPPLAGIDAVFDGPR